MNAAGATITIFLAFVVLVGSRTWAALGIMAGVCYVTQGQQIYVQVFHFTAIRLILLAGIVRCLIRGELKAIKYSSIDGAMIGFMASGLIIYMARERTSEAFVFFLGIIYDTMLAYYVIRSLITSGEDALKFFHRLAFVVFPFAVLMLQESLTHYNAFRFMGGQGWDEGVFREGRIRCVASFRGPHSAGIFGATMAPFFFALWFASRKRLAGTLGLVAAVVITFTSNSSGPLTAFVMGVVGISFWRFRHHMQTIRRVIVVALISCHLMMKAPVWFLFSRMSDILGGDGWNRSMVIDRTVHHFSEWWLLGAKDTLRWMWNNPDLTGEMDLTDQFVGTAVSGGLLTLIFYILIFVRSFGQLGRAIHRVKEHSTETTWLLWSLGAALFAHLMALFSVGYFDQISVWWWGFVAIIASVSTDALKSAPVPYNADAPDGEFPSDAICEPVG